MSETVKKTTTKKTTPKAATEKSVKAAPAAKKPAVAKESAPAAASKIALVPKPAPTHEQIARRAYEIWAGRGYNHGNQAHDWWQAEQELKRA